MWIHCAQLDLTDFYGGSMVQESSIAMIEEQDHEETSGSAPKTRSSGSGDHSSLGHLGTDATA